MALYLGREKLGVTVERERNCLKGTVTSDANGIIVFPELSFTPTMITVWNIEETDWSTDPDWEDDWVRYTYNGIMLTAIYQNGTWIAQVPVTSSGGVNISNATYTTNTAIGTVVGLYTYDLHFAESAPKNFANMEFNYAIYG